MDIWSQRRPIADFPEKGENGVLSPKEYLRLKGRAVPSNGSDGLIVGLNDVRYQQGVGFENMVGLDSSGAMVGVCTGIEHESLSVILSRPGVAERCRKLIDWIKSFRR